MINFVRLQQGIILQLPGNTSSILSCAELLWSARDRPCALRSKGFCIASLYIALVREREPKNWSCRSPSLEQKTKSGAVQMLLPYVADVGYTIISSAPASRGSLIVVEAGASSGSATTTSETTSPTCEPERVEGCFRLYLISCVFTNGMASL